jgi:hypothetical protein
MTTLAQVLEVVAAHQVHHGHPGGIRVLPGYRFRINASQWIGAGGVLAIGAPDLGGVSVQDIISRIHSSLAVPSTWEAEEYDGTTWRKVRF